MSTRDERHDAINQWLRDGESYTRFDVIPTADGMRVRMADGAVIEGPDAVNTALFGRERRKPEELEPAPIYPAPQS